MGNTILIPAVDDVGNILTNAGSVTPSSADSLFPKKYLTDGDTGPLFKHSAAAANDNVIFDLDQLHGGFEDWGASDPLPPGWSDDSSGTGAIARETTTVNSGSVAAKLTGGGSGNEARLKRTIRLPAGWAATASLAVRGDGTNAINVYILNRETGRYLLSNETWSTTKTAYASRSTDSYAAEGTPANFTVEAASVGLRGIYHLDIWAEQVTGDGYLDDFYIWPHWDFAAVFNHNLGANITARIRSDDSSSMSSPTNRVAFTLRRPAMFGEPASTVTERYAQFYTDGTNPVAGEIGEIVLSQRLDVDKIDPYAATPDVGLVGDARRPTAFREDEGASFSVSFRVYSEADWNDVRHKILQSARWGGRRAVIVPLVSEADVYYGTYRPTSWERQGAGHIYRVDGQFSEMSYAIRAT